MKLNKACFGMVLGLGMLVALAGARADVVGGEDTAEPVPGFEAAWTDELSSIGIPCSGIEDAGCCEAGVLFFCTDGGNLDAIECARNEDYTVCASHEDPAYANCMMPTDSFMDAPRCSVEPAPYPGEPSLPDPGDLAGTCPTLPRSMKFEFHEAPYCDGIPQNVAIYQVGCAFVMETPSGGQAYWAIGHMNGRVVQMSYRVGDGSTIVTCLGEISEDDAMFRGQCDGPWGYGDANPPACRFSFGGEIRWDWEAPEPVVDPGPGPQPGVDAGGTDQPGDSGGSSGCNAGHGTKSPFVALLLALAFGFAIFRRRAIFG